MTWICLHVCVLEMWGSVGHCYRLCILTYANMKSVCLFMCVCTNNQLMCLSSTQRRFCLAISSTLNTTLPTVSPTFEAFPVSFMTERDTQHIKLSWGLHDDIYLCNDRHFICIVCVLLYVQSYNQDRKHMLCCHDIDQTAMSY